MRKEGRYYPTGSITRIVRIFILSAVERFFSMCYGEVKELLVTYDSRNVWIEKLENVELFLGLFS